MIAGFGLATLCCSALGGRSFWGGRFLHMHWQQQLLFFLMFSFCNSTLGADNTSWKVPDVVGKRKCFRCCFFFCRAKKKKQQQKHFLFPVPLPHHIWDLASSYSATLPHHIGPPCLDILGNSLNHISAPCLMLQIAEEGGQVQHEQHRRRHQEAQQVFTIPSICILEYFL